MAQSVPAGKKLSEDAIKALVLKTIRNQQTPTNRGKRQQRASNKIKRNDRSSYPITGSNNPIRAIYGGADDKNLTNKHRSYARNTSTDTTEYTRAVGGNSTEHYYLHALDNPNVTQETHPAYFPSKEA